MKARPEWILKFDSRDECSSFIEDLRIELKKKGMSTVTLPLRCWSNIKISLPTEQEDMTPQEIADVASAIENAKAKQLTHGTEVEIKA